MATTAKTLMYRGRPLRRKDNIIYYGSMSDKYIIMMQVLSTKAVVPAEGSDVSEPLSVADRVSIQLQLTDPDVKSRDRVVKKAERNGLYDAMDVAAIWLERALRD